MPMAAIQDYAAIGNCRGIALVSRAGSIDWLCWPRFDSPSIFGALLDKNAGRWSVEPVGSFQITRRYLDETNILETRFESNTATLIITDLMPVTAKENIDGFLVPDHEILRMIKCERGEVEIRMHFEPRPQYGLEQPQPKMAGLMGTCIETSQGLLMLRSDFPITIDRGRVYSKVTLTTGDIRHLSLTLADEGQAVFPPLGAWSQSAIDRSVAWWKAWVSQLRYAGPAREAVVRSALMLKLLIYGPSGAVVAAPTTSLPEQMGGSLNWDYRYCWLRDASMTLRALYTLGCTSETEAFLSWLQQTTRLTQPQLGVLYDVYGNLPKDEEVLEHLSGYNGSRPVRRGNAAAKQLQLDIYGEVIDTAVACAFTNGGLSRDTQDFLIDLGQYVCQNWFLPDQGIWEPRGAKQHNTHSRLLCWTALDRLLALQHSNCLPQTSMYEFSRQRALIRREIEERAWNQKLESYVATLDGHELDASLLLFAKYGFESASSYRMQKTYERICQSLGAGNNLLYRYSSSATTQEGVFGICGFWGAEFLALGGGTAEQASEAFERLCCYGNDVGLFAEEFEPATGEALGNFPQGLTHVGLINAALSLTKRLKVGESVDSQPKEAHSEGSHV
jgi:GH15 family glucan-1,4-alpha-glucosidase